MISHLARSLVLILALGSAARAEFLDFSDITWTPGTLDNTYTGGDLGGQQVRLLFTDNGGVIVADPTEGVNTPFITVGNSGFDHSLQWRMDVSDTTGTLSQFVRLEIIFTTPVSNLTFHLGDVDTGSNNSQYSGWQDVVAISAFNGATEVAVTGSDYGGVDGETSGAAYAVSPDGANDYKTTNNLVVYGHNPALSQGVGATYMDGNLQVDVSATMTRLVIDFYPGASDGANADGIPGEGPDSANSQFIRLHDISFTRVPEPSTIGMVVVSGLGVAGLWLRRRAAKAKAA